MERILQNLIENETIKKETNKEEIINILDDIKKEVLYKSYFHGLHHSQKVTYFTYLLAVNEKLNSEEFKIVIDAAKYHDIGRYDDSEDQYHGLVSANKIDEVVNYDNLEDLYYLKAICEVHSLDDSADKRIFDNYNFEYYEETGKNLDYQKYKRLARIIKDADALDRTRFGNSYSSLNPQFLRIPYSHELIELSKKINKHYQMKISDSYIESLTSNYEYDENGDIKTCFHSIGFDFFKLDSILKYGILSDYRANKLKINLDRNFSNNNSNVWISVTDSKGVEENLEAYKKFVMQGISFYCYTNYLKEGEYRNKNNGSMNPRKSDEYNDERFIFDSIKLEQIKVILIPEQLKNKKLDNLYYLNVCDNYEVVKNKIFYYIKKIKEDFDISINYDQLSELLKDYYNMTKHFSSLGEEQQKFGYERYINNLTNLKNKLNKEIQEYINNYYQCLFEKQNVSLKEVLEYYLNKNNIKIISEYETDEILIMIDTKNNNKKYYIS